MPLLFTLFDFGFEQGEFVMFLEIKGENQDEYLG